MLGHLLYPKTQHAFDKGMKLYTHGGYSKPVANLKILPDGLPADIRKHDEFKAVSQDGTHFVGRALKDFKKGESNFQFLYPGDYYACQVGGLPEKEMFLDGCLPSKGKITMVEDGTNLAYEYDVLSHNYNARTLASLSTQDNKRMRPEETKPYFHSFQPFYDYYGTYAYAHEIILAGFQAKDTDFKRDNFHLSTKPDDFEARLGKKNKRFYCRYNNNKRVGGS